MTTSKEAAKTKSMKKQQAGFTLVELMITLIIASIITMIASPSLNTLFENNRLTTQSNNLVSSLSYARSIAINRGTTITICVSTDEATCTGTNWYDGWIVTDTATTEVFRVFPNLDGDGTLVNAESNSSIAFTATGFLATAAATTFNLCYTTGTEGRRITIVPSGRPTSLTPFPICP